MVVSYEKLHGEFSLHRLPLLLAMTLMENSQFISKVRYDEEVGVKKRMKSVENPSFMYTWLSEAWMLHFHRNADTGMAIFGHQNVGVL